MSKRLSSNNRQLHEERQKMLTDGLGSFIAEACDLIRALLPDPYSAKLSGPAIEKARRYLATRGPITEDPYWITKMRTMLAADDARQKRKTSDPWSV